MKSRVRTPWAARTSCGPTGCRHRLRLCPTRRHRLHSRRRSQHLHRRHLCQCTCAVTAPCLTRRQYSPDLRVAPQPGEGTIQPGARGYRRGSSKTRSKYGYADQGGEGANSNGGVAVSIRSSVCYCPCYPHCTPMHVKRANKMPICTMITWPCLHQHRKPKRYDGSVPRSLYNQ